MATQPMMPISGYGEGVAMSYALMGVNGYGLAVVTVAAMLDPNGAGAARALQPGEPIPIGSIPVLVGDTTVYSAVCVESMLQHWSTQVPRPWLVLIADAPAAAPPAARYRVRALQSRLLGVAHVPYLPSLRTAESPAAALEQRDVQKAAAHLRRQIEGTTK